MSSNGIQLAIRQVGKTLKQNSPTILTGLSVAGLISTVSLAIYATPKAIEILASEELRRDRESMKKDHKDAPDPLPISKLDVIKLTWKCYVPAITVGAVTIFCMIGANNISLRRNAALTSLYALTEQTMQEYKNKVIDTIGKNKEEKISDALIDDKLTQNPISNNTVIVTGKGNTLCYDILSGRYFNSDIETIRKMQNDFNAELIKSMYLDLNEWYDAIGLEGTKTGRDTGWTTDFGMLDIVFSAKIADNGQPCIVLDYRNGPRAL